MPPPLLLPVRPSFRRVCNLPASLCVILFALHVAAFLLMYFAHRTRRLPPANCFISYRSFSHPACCRSWRDLLGFWVFNFAHRFSSRWRVHLVFYSICSTKRLYELEGERRKFRYYNMGICIQRSAFTCVLFGVCAAVTNCNWSFRIRRREKRNAPRVLNTKARSRLEYMKKWNLLQFQILTIWSFFLYIFRKLWNIEVLWDFYF